MHSLWRYSVRREPFASRRTVIASSKAGYHLRWKNGSSLTGTAFSLNRGSELKFLWRRGVACCSFPLERAKVALQLKHLVTPAGMGENFQVLVAAQGVDPQRVAGLSGLSFTRSRM